MKSPRVPDREPERVAALQALNLLDTQPEERFDRLTRLARRFFSVQTVLVTLVDDDRQWFKSRQGMDVCETGRDISFCGHAILEDGIFEITDASQDDRFFDNPLVTAPPYIRFYAGVPLLSADGFRVGTFCLIDPQPRKLDPVERQSLLDFAASVEAEINAVRESKLKGILAKSEARNQAIARAQSYFIRGVDKPRAFQSLLEDILKLTNSDCGLIGEVMQEHNREAKAAHQNGFADRSVDQEFEILASTAADKAMLSDFVPLLRSVMASGEIGLDKEAGHRSPKFSQGGAESTPALAVPVHYNGQLVAVLLIAKRRDVYDPETVEFLQPIIAMLGQLVSTLQIQKDNEKKQREIERLSRVAKETTNSVVITDTKGRVEWVNESFTRITGYSLDEVIGCTPGEILQGKDTDPGAVMQMHQALQSHQPFEVDVSNYTKSGKRFWMHVSCDTLRSPSGEHEGFIAIESDVTAQKEAEASVHEMLERLKKLTSNLPGMIYQYQLWPDGRSCLPYASEGLTSVYGIAASDVDQDASPILDMIHPEDRPRVMESIQLSADSLSLWEDRFRLIHPTGQSIWIEGRATPERLEDGSTLWHGFLADISERVRLEQSQQDEAAHTQAILDNVVDGIVTIDSDGVVGSVNHAVEKMFGYSAGEVLGKNVTLLVPKIYRAFSGKLFGEEKAGGEPTDIRAIREMKALRKDGGSFPVDLAFSKILRQGKTVYIGVIRDISERKRSEKEINKLAFYDSLTMIPNRRLFYDRLEHTRSSSKRSKNYNALLLIDLDNFKRLNDTAGHYTGDRLLQAVAKRLLRCVRRSDTVARLGGDEFMVLLEGLGENLEFAAAHVECVGEKILRSISQPYPEVHQKYNGSSRACSH
jgi:diguanylate cyclase (GGDEF)-like protein/PAS domain S-box-containing protein